MVFIALLSAASNANNIEQGASGQLMKKESSGMKGTAKDRSSQRVSFGSLDEHHICDESGDFMFGFYGKDLKDVVSSEPSGSDQAGTDLPDSLYEREKRSDESTGSVSEDPDLKQKREELQKLLGEWFTARSFESLELVNEGDGLAVKMGFDPFPFVDESYLPDVFKELPMLDSCNSEKKNYLEIWPDLEEGLCEAFLVQFRKVEAVKAGNPWKMAFLGKLLEIARVLLGAHNKQADANKSLVELETMIVSDGAEEPRQQDVLSDQTLEKNILWTEEVALRKPEVLRLKRALITAQNVKRSGVDLAAYIRRQIERIKVD